MENINENPFAENIAVEVPPVEQPPVIEEPVVESPVVEETSLEPVKEEAPAQEANTNDVIGAPSYSGNSETQALGAVNNGAIGATTAPKTSKKSSAKKESEKKETVALHSTRNVTWSGVGKVYRGYNIVEKSEADQWLTRSHIRLATPEEVAKEFGK